MYPDHPGHAYACANDSPDTLGRPTGASGEQCTMIVMQSELHFIKNTMIFENGNGFYRFPGISGNFREFPGIPGNLGNSREFPEFPEIPRDSPGNSGNLPGISGNPRYFPGKSPGFLENPCFCPFPTAISNFLTFVRLKIPWAVEEFP